MSIACGGINTPLGWFAEPSRRRQSLSLSPNSLSSSTPNPPTSPSIRLTLTRQTILPNLIPYTGGGGNRRGSEVRANRHSSSGTSDRGTMPHPSLFSIPNLPISFSIRLSPTHKTNPNQILCIGGGGNGRSSDGGGGNGGSSGGGGGNGGSSGGGGQDDDNFRESEESRLARNERIREIDRKGLEAIRKTTIEGCGKLAVVFIVYQILDFVMGRDKVVKEKSEGTEAHSNFG